MSKNIWSRASRSRFIISSQNILSSTFVIPTSTLSCLRLANASNSSPANWFESPLPDYQAHWDCDCSCTSQVGEKIGGRDFLEFDVNGFTDTRPEFVPREPPVHSELIKPPLNGPPCVTFLPCHGPVEEPQAHEAPRCHPVQPACRRRYWSRAPPPGNARVPVQRCLIGVSSSNIALRWWFIRTLDLDAPEGRRPPHWPPIIFIRPHRRCHFRALAEEHELILGDDRRNAKVKDENKGWVGECCEWNGNCER